MENICKWCKAVLKEGEAPLAWILKGKSSQCISCHEELVYLVKEAREEFGWK